MYAGTAEKRQAQWAKPAFCEIVPPASEALSCGLDVGPDHKSGLNLWAFSPFRPPAQPHLTSARSSTLHYASPCARAPQPADPNSGCLSAIPCSNFTKLWTPPVSLPMAVKGSSRASNLPDDRPDGYDSFLRTAGTIPSAFLDDADFSIDTLQSS